MHLENIRLGRLLLLSGVAIVTGLVLILGLVGASTTLQAALTQQIQCDWDAAGRAATESFHAASAMDTDRNQLYVYGGLDALLAASSTIERGDYANFSGRVDHQRLRIAGVPERFGAAGAYRARGADADDSALYFIGGLSDAEDGQTEPDIQHFSTKAETWTKLRQTVAARAFASATYDPEHDLIWVIGGVGQCSLRDLRLAGQSCQARNLATQYLGWDPATGELEVHTLAGGGVSRFGHSAVYDAVNKRILVYGGTSDIRRGSDVLVALDLADPDPAKARFEPVATTGRAPRVYFHGAALNPDRHWMIVSGGLSQGFLTDNESTESKTYALHLASPELTWTDLGASPQERVAGVMAWAAQPNLVIYTMGRTKFTGDTSRPQNGLRNTHALACQALPATATPMPTSAMPSPPPATPTPRTGPPPTTPQPDDPIERYEPHPEFEVCPQIQGRVPDAIVQRALANAPTEARRCNPNVPISPDNLFRDKLTLQDNNKPYHLIFNRLQWKCGCQ